MNEANCFGRPLMSSAQTILCTKLPLFAQSFVGVKEGTTACIVSCVTNFIADSSEESMEPGQRVDQVLKEFFSIVVDACKNKPDRVVLVCPPMYRQSPIWYRENLPEVMTRFSSSFARSSLLIKNLFAMPSFATPVFESDGTHLTPASGHEFILHLFARAQMILDALIVSPDGPTSGDEDVWVLQDRVMATELDLRRLSSAFELKTAIDSELACFRMNERNEDSLIISGLPRIRGGLSGKERQAKAKDSVQNILRGLTKEAFRIVVVHNVTGRSSDSVPTYSVRLDSVEASRSIRSRFSSFFKGGTDARPTELQSISISNVITRETRIRISLLKVFAKRYVDSNPGAKAQVIGYEPRPLLKLTPPSDSNSRPARVQTFTFIEAVQKLPAAFTDEEVGKILRQASAQFPGRLRSLFVVLSDDRVRVAKGRKRPADGGVHEPPSQRHASS